MSLQTAIHLPPDHQTAGNLASAELLFIGTATVLLRIGGYTILTDPNFIHQGEHVHLGYGMFSTRQTHPAIEIHQLPPLDLILVSHWHRDHFDQVAERRLNRVIPLISTTEAARTLTRRGFQDTRGLDPWDSVEIRKQDALPLRITAMPGRHGPGLMNMLLPRVVGFLLQFGAGPGFRIYISGDTLVHQDLREIPRRVPGIDLALLHLGGTRILGALVTMDGEQGVEMLKILQPSKAIPVHYNDYPVFKSPLVDFQRAAKNAGLESRVHSLKHGERYRFALPKDAVPHSQTV